MRMHTKTSRTKLDGGFSGRSSCGHWCRCDHILKRELELRYDYSSMAAYRSVDRYNDGRINTFNMGTFLRQCGHYASETELLAIVRRIDTDGDAQLSYAEFADYIRSTNPPIRPSYAEQERAASEKITQIDVYESANLYVLVGHKQTYGMRCMLKVRWYTGGDAFVCQVLCVRAHRPQKPVNRA